MGAGAGAVADGGARVGAVVVVCDEGVGGGEELGAGWWHCWERVGVRGVVG